MLPGKVPPEILESHVFKHLGKSHPDLILGPSLGQDASLIRFGDRVLVASTDPITGSVEDIGWLAVHINANDIATFGVQPTWFLNSIMLPVGSTPSDLEHIMKQIHEAASSLNITVAGGHTEITEDIDKPIIAGFMLGETVPGQYVTSSGATAGDSIILTKSVAIEGTAILAAEGRSYLTSKLGSELVESAISLRDYISVVKEGVASFNTGHITAMHDPTEGGLANGIHELCTASGVGFRINYQSIPVHASTKAICDFLAVNPLNLISSGCMLMTCHVDNSKDVLATLEKIGVDACVIGQILEDKNIRLVEYPDSESDLGVPTTDALWGALKMLPSS